jgi:hypothetical protein
MYAVINVLNTSLKTMFQLNKYEAEKSHLISLSLL